MTNQKSAHVTTRPLTERDREIVRAVVNHGQMTRTQIQQLYFRRGDQLVSAQTTLRRLKLLCDREYLSHVRRPAMVGSGPYVYEPGPAAGAALDPDEKAKARWGASKRWLAYIAGLPHAVEVVDFYTALRLALEESGGQILSWLGEGKAHYRFSYHQRRVLLSPDAYGAWTLAGEEGAFFLEWDRGTESMIRLGQKLARYEEYYQVRAHHDHLGVDGLKPRLLFVVPDKRRRAKLVRWIARRLRNGDLAVLPSVLVGERDRVMEDLLGRVWHRVGQEGSIGLVD